MQLNMNGIEVSVDESQVARIVRTHILGEPANTGYTVPPIGEAWPEQAGIYAGIARGRDGEPDYHLIVGPEICGEGATWDEATQALGDDWSLPYRSEQALMFANVPELFEKTWYWSCEQHASDSHDAWYQNFDNGYQDYLNKNGRLRARAVRRFPI